MACELLQQLALLAAEPGGHVHLRGELVVAAGHGVTQPRHPLALEGYHCTGLGAGRNLQGFLAVHGLHLNGVAQDGLQIADGQLREDGGALPAQFRVSPHPEEHVEVAGGSAPLAGIALVGHPQARAGVNAAGNADA